MRDVEVDQENRWLRAGETVGRYVIVEDSRHDQSNHLLRAYDPILQREVALHCERVDELSVLAQEALLGRARAIAKLSHPNIIAVYDVEHVRLAAGGAVVTATECIGGTTLERWLRDVHPSLDIVKAYVAAGRGLVTAQRAGLVHRLEPANVLIGRDGRVRLSLLGWEASESPAQKSSEDQHSFCTALWQALTKDVSPAAGDIGPRELTIPKPVRNALRRGMSPHESDRWPSMEALLDALEYDHAQRRRLWLLAGAVSCSFVASGIAAQTWSAESPQLCSGAQAQLAGVWDSDRRDDVQGALIATGEAYAPDVAERVGPALSRYASEWVTLHTEICEATTVRHEQSPEVMDLRMTCLHRAKVELAAVAELLRRPDAQVVLKASEVVASLPSLGRCSDVAALQADVPPPTPSDEGAVEAARVELAEVKVLRTAGKVSEALARIQDLAERVEHIAYAPLETDAWLELGLASEGAGALGEAKTALLAALRSGLSNRQWEQAQAAASRLVYTVGHLQSHTREAKAHAATARGLLRLSEPSAEATLRSHIGSVLEIEGDYAQAEAEHRAALALRERLLPPEHPDIAASRGSIGVVLDARGRYAEAEVEQRSALASWMAALGPKHPHVASTRDNLGSILQAQGRYPEAEVEHRAALALQLEVLGAEHPDVGYSRNNLASALQEQGRYQDAESQYREALAIWQKALGPEHPNVAVVHNNLGAVLEVQGRFAEAEVEHRAALALRQRTLGSEHPRVAISRNGLGTNLKAQGRLIEAEIELRAATALWAKTMGAEHPKVAVMQSNLGSVLHAQGRYAEAEAELRRALALLLRVPDDPEIPYVRRHLAITLKARGRYEEAETELRAAEAASAR